VNLFNWISAVKFSLRNGDKAMINLALLIDKAVSWEKKDQNQIYYTIFVLLSLHFDWCIFLI